MAPSLVQRTSNGSTSGGTVTVTLGAGTTAGNCLAVMIYVLGSTTNPSSISGVTLGGVAGNFSSRVVVGASATTFPMTAIWVCENAAGGQTSVVVSTTGGTGTIGLIAFVEEWSGIATGAGAATDQSNSGSNGTGSSAFSSGATPTTTNANEAWLGIGGFASGGTPTITGPAGPWSNQTAFTETIGGIGAGAVSGSQAATSTGAATYSGTLSASEVWSAVVLTLLPAAPPGISSMPLPMLAPGWQPGTRPGMPGGTPFYAPWTGGLPPAAVPVTGTGSLALLKPSLAGTGTAAATGTGSLALLKPSLSGAGAQEVTGTGSLRLPKPSLSGTGSVAATGTGSLALVKPKLAGTGTGSVVTGTGSLALPKPGLAGTASEAAVFDALPSTTFPAQPLDGRAELLLGGTWTDITSYVVQPLDSAVPITRGHPDESTTTAPSGVPLTLFNGDGRFSSKNPAGPYYGQLVRNVPLRFSIPEGASYLRFEPDQYSYAQCPDATGLDITGDMEIQLDISLDNWNSNQILACKWGASSSQATWILELLESGILQFNFSSNGTGIDGAPSTVPVPLPPLHRMCLRVTYASSTGTVTFYTSPPGLSSPSWTQLGAARTYGSSISLFNSAAPVQLGFGTDTNDGYSGIYGKFHAFQLLNGIGGTAAASPDFTAQTPGTTSFADAQGNTWSLNGTAAISDRKYRIHAETSAWPQFWDPTGHNVTVQLTAAGVLRRLGANAGGQLFASAMYRAYQRLTGSTAPVAYWPGEDGANSTQIASGLGGPAMQVTTAPQFGGSSAFLCSRPIPALVAGSTWTGTVPAYTGGADNVLRFLMAVPSGGDTNAAVIARMYTTGPAVRVDLVYSTGGALTLNLYNGTGGLLATSGVQAFGVNGELMRVSMELQASGANLKYNIATLLPGGSSALDVSSTLSATAIGNVTQVIINPGGLLTSTAIGQISVQPVWDSLFDLNGDHLASGSWTGALDAWQGETAGNRFKRLCDEEGISFRGQGNLGATVAMGPQLPAALTTLWQECVDADRGTMFEPRQAGPGLGYRTRASMCNQGSAVTIPYSMLMSPLLPTEDDQIVQNDVTCTQNQDGSFSEQVLAAGPLSVQEPPDGAGRYPVAVPVNLAADSQLDSEAGWVLHMGTVDEPRYPALRIDLASAEAGIAGIFFDLLDLDIGDRVTVTGTPPWLPPDGIDVLIQGVTPENIWLKKLNVAWACVPASPWNVAVANDAVWGKADTDGSTLHTSVSSSATSMSVDTANALSPLWTTAGGDFPFDVLMSGERITVTAISGASSPQTFTVTRSVNGVAKAQSAGTAVALFSKPIASL